MGKISIASTLLTAVVITTAGVSVSTAGFPAPPGVNVQIQGFLPAPPGVHIYMEGGTRPYYVEHERRVYVEREPKHYKKKHRREHEYRDDGDRGRHNDEDHGRKHGHGNHD